MNEKSNVKWLSQYWRVVKIFRQIVIFIIFILIIFYCTVTNFIAFNFIKVCFITFECRGIAKSITYYFTQWISLKVFFECQNSKGVIKTLGYL